MTLTNQNRRFAVLVDADNAQASTIESILAEIARYGIVTSKRCCGDWTVANLSPWKETLLKFAIKPMQQFAYTRGKNATDSAMIIDAMDLLYTNNFDGFCIVSSDSDFTRLATRLRESGLEVLGFGRKTTPEPFRVACNKFTFTEVLLNTSEENIVTVLTPPTIHSPSDNQSTDCANEKGNTDGVSEQLQNIIADDKIQNPTVQGQLTIVDTVNSNDLKSLLKQAVDSLQGNDGFSNLADVGGFIQRIQPEIDPRNYGGTNKKLGDLVKKQDYIEYRVENGGLYIRFKVLPKT